MDTIVALATPPGRSAIGLIRMSGPDALRITRALVLDDRFLPDPAHCVLKSIRNPVTGEVMDQALVCHFAAPRSFTGEDVVEISCHGSPVILRDAIDSILRLGARLAGPGEFTLRALGNGKLNLDQAEAIRDLINAQTDAAARQAARQMDGELSCRLQEFKDRLLALIVKLESAIEFVEDDLPEVRAQEAMEDVLSLISDISFFASTFKTGQLLRNGLRVTIIGRPNTGKSSLFNELLKTDRAIVTEIAGTTRDTLTEAMDLQGLPVLLTDTAGIRESDGPVEAVGIERTKRAIAESDLLLLVLDGSVELTSEDQSVLNETAGYRRVVALNKSDLPTFAERLDHRSNGHLSMVHVSAKTRSGLDQLRRAMLDPFCAFDTHEAGLLITDARHYDLLCRTQAELESSLKLIEHSASEELVLVGLHNALRFLGEITGETTTEDLLSKIFSTFCIGK
jgi:tRNA modification GTPase